jgi:hypothetical protein
MKITQILFFLICFICFSCDTKPSVDTNDDENIRKVDSINRVQFLAHSDSADKLYTSIKIPHTWKETMTAAEILRVPHRKDTVDRVQRIHIDISTAMQVDLLWSVNGEKTKVFNIINMSEKGDSIIFNTVQIETKETIDWFFKYINNEKTLGTWSIYNPDKKTILVTGKYTSQKGDNE